MSNLVPSLGISLIITSRDRQTDLDRFVNAVSQQTFPGQIEILFVAQGQAQLNLRNPGRGNVKVIVHDHGAWLGLSKARNLGLKECTGDVIGFPDDDCWYEPDFLRKLAAYFEEHPEVDCVCTNVFDPERKVSLGRRPVGITRKVSFRNLFRFPISVGIFVRRESFLKIGGRFNELLGAGSSMGSGEETELVARMLAYSMRVEYVGDLQVYHAVPRPASSDISKHYRYSIGFGSLHG